MHEIGRRFGGSRKRLMRVLATWLLMTSPVWLTTCGGASKPVAVVSEPEACLVLPLPSPPTVHPFPCGTNICLTPEDARAIGQWGIAVGEAYASLRTCPALKFRGESELAQDIRAPGLLRGAALIRRIGTHGGI